MLKKENKNVLKVIQLNLQDRVYNSMKKQDFSVEGLCREFNNEGLKITAQSIRKFIKKTKQAQQELIKKDVKLSNEIMKTAMDYNKALREILNEVKDVKNQAKDEKDFTTYNQLIGRLLQGIELFAKLTGDMKPKGNVDINIIYNEINDNIENKMEKAKKDIFDSTNIIDVEYEIINDDKKLYEQLVEEETKWPYQKQCKMIYENTLSSKK